MPTTSVLIDSLSDICCKIVYRGGVWCCVSIDETKSLRVNREMHPEPRGPDHWWVDARTCSKAKAEQLVIAFLRGT